MRIWGMTDIGLVRKENQDAYLVKTSEENGYTVAVVCDGMGGTKGGKIASELAVHTFVDACLTNLCGDLTMENVREVTAFAIQEANRVIYERSLKDKSLCGMGTTLVSAVVWDDHALINNVGDSRAYLLQQKDGRQFAPITTDHSFVQSLVDKGDITPEEARSHPNRNLITRALGPEALTSSDSYEVSLETGDAILLCTDGLIDTVSDEEMAREISRGSENTCMDRLLKMAHHRGAPDNVTAVLLRQM